MKLQNPLEKEPEVIPTEQVNVTDADIERLKQIEQKFKQKCSQ